jgi:immune inhibitor A
LSHKNSYGIANITSRVAIVLAEFRDKRMAGGAKERFQELFFSTGKIPTGSVSEYFADVSNGKISLAGEIVGPFTMPQTLVQYAGSDNGLSSATPNIQTLAADALAAADGHINLKPYDNDNNGYVDAFIVVHAGSGAEQTRLSGDIWSAKWNLPQETKVDGVTVWAFLTIPEDAKIGVSAHEIGHLVFGWPDLYDTDGTSQGIGNWCLMSGGSWGGVDPGTRPCHPSAWCKANQGWVNVVVETDNHQVTCSDVKLSKQVNRLWTNGDVSSQEYFLIENRQLYGFDTSLPGGGLLGMCLHLPTEFINLTCLCFTVWHIDDSKDTNTDENHPKVRLVQADGLDQLKLSNSGRGDAGDPFPGTANSRSFTVTSNPGSKSYKGDDTLVSITSISPASSTMTMDITVKPTVSPGFNAHTWYRLRNTFAGYALDVVNDGRGSRDGFIQMAREGNFSGQHWQIKPRTDGTYSLCTMFLGSGMQLDVYGNDKTKPHLAPAGNYSGQFWQINPWGDGSFHLSNAYSGPELYLDTMEGGPRVAMNASNVGRPTQRWTITPIRAITEIDFQVGRKSVL